MKRFFSFLYRAKTQKSELQAKQTAEGRLAYETAKRALHNNPPENEKYELLELLDIAISNGINEAYLERTFCLHELGFDIDAIDDFDKAENLCTNEPALYFARGISKRILMDFDSAIIDFEKALDKAKQSNHYINANLIEFEIQLKTTMDRKKHFENPIIKEAFLKQKGEPKRRTK
jgi:tetratricopeptide (TPR) repeat protein